MKQQSKKCLTDELIPEIAPPDSVNPPTVPDVRFTGTPLSIYISDTRIKLLLARKQGIERWDDAVLPPGLVSGGKINDPKAVAGILAGIMSKNHFKHDKTIAGLSGLHSISRIIKLPLAASRMLDEAVRHEAENGLPVKPESVYLYWHILRQVNDELELFVIAYEKKVIDVMVETLRLTGFSSFVLELVPIALTRSADSRTVAMFDVRPGEFDIIRIKDNFPEIIRTLPLPSGISTADNMPVIEEELERTMRYSYPEEAPDGEKTVTASGIYNNGHDVFRTLTDRLGVPVKPLSLPIAYPENFPAADYVVNLCLLLRAATGLNNIVLPKINLLPEKTKRKVNKLVIAGIIAVAGLAAGILPLIDNQEALADLRSRIDNGREVLSASRNSQKALLELDNQISRVSAVTAGLETILANNADGNKLIYEDMHAALTLLPPGVNVLEINCENGLVIHGTADAAENALVYSRLLMDSGRFAKLKIASLQENGAGYSYRLILNH